MIQNQLDINNPFIDDEEQYNLDNHFDYDEDDRKEQ